MSTPKTTVHRSNGVLNSRLYVTVHPGFIRGTVNGERSLRAGRDKREFAVRELTTNHELKEKKK